MKLREILTDIHVLETELLDFERKYGVRSETFYNEVQRLQPQAPSLAGLIRVAV